MFDLDRTAQAAAYLLAKAPQHTLSKLKLMKLLYLADRTSFATYGTTISGDRLVSMPHGPVLSRTLGALRMEDAAPADWTMWVRHAGGNDFTLADHADIDAAGRLSDADIAILDDVWTGFGAMTAIQLRNWTHDPHNCPEYRDPNGSSHPITIEDLGRALGFTAAEIAAAEAYNDELDSITRALAAL